MQTGLRHIRSFRSPHSLRHCSSSYLKRFPLSKPLPASIKSTFSWQVVLFELLILIKFVKIFSGNLLCVLEVLSLLGISPKFTLDIAPSQRTLWPSLVCIRRKLFSYISLVVVNNIIHLQKQKQDPSKPTMPSSLIKKYD